MACAGLSCRQGRSKCETPWTCGGYANEAHYSAMHAAPGSFYPRDTASDEAQDRIKADEDSAIVVKGAWLGLAIVAAVVAAITRWLYLNWWALRALMGI